MGADDAADRVSDNGYNNTLSINHSCRLIYNPYLFASIRETYEHKNIHDYDYASELKAAIDFHLLCPYRLFPIPYVCLQFLTVILSLVW